MRRYVQISGIFFALLALVQLTRTLSGWPVQVAERHGTHLGLGGRVCHHSRLRDVGAAGGDE